MTEKKYGAAIIGYGGMGSYHGILMKEHKRITLIGAYDILEERRAAAVKDGYKAYGSVQEILNDSTIDVVIIATPNDVHKEIAIAALNAKKNVICEKPVTIVSEDLSHIMACAEANGRLFVVHQNRRWDEDFQTIRKIHDEQIVGDIFHIESRVQGANGIPGDWRHQKECGGGMLLDWGIHLLDQLLFMVDGKIESVYSTLSFVLGNDVDDGFTVQIAFENGTTALVEVGTTNYIQMPRWYVKGTLGSAIINDWDHKNGKIVVRNVEENLEAPKPIRAGRGLTKTMAPPSDSAVITLPLPEPATMQEEYYSNIVSILDKKAEPIVKNEEVLRVMRLIEAIFKSGETGEVVKNFDII